MKRFYRNIILILATFLILTTIDLYGQKMEGDRRSITIVYPDSTVKSTMLTSMKELKTKSDLMYYWVYNERIFWNRGDYAYYLLDGEYRVFDKNNSLITKGAFRQGVKDSEWKSWYLNGELSSKGNWKKGQKQGLWNYFNSEGNVIAQLKYKDDLLTGKCIYYQEEENFVKRYKKGVEKKKMFHWFSTHSEEKGEIPVDEPIE